MIWFLVLLTSTGPANYLGPMKEESCRAAAAALAAEQATCERAYSFMACEAAGRPGVLYACPVFDRDTPRAGAATGGATTPIPSD